MGSDGILIFFKMTIHKRTSAEDRVQSIVASLPNRQLFVMVGPAFKNLTLDFPLAVRRQRDGHRLTGNHRAAL